ncbi:hypothetical protein PK28_04100 [Hymenobacter sp. DG25B]|nr:hypothetical protein PK28_04100 [Hymenobacter sp. DG25B]
MQLQVKAGKPAFYQGKIIQHIPLAATGCREQTQLLGEGRLVYFPAPRPALNGQREYREVRSAGLIYLHHGIPTASGSRQPPGVGVRHRLRGSRHAGIPGRQV